MRTIERGVTLGFFYLLLIFIPFGTRNFIYRVISGFHEYESLFIYASDFFLVGSLLGILLFNKRVRLRKRIKRILIPLFVFLVAVLVSVFVAFDFVLAIYAFVRLLLLIGFVYLILTIIRNSKIFYRVMGVIGVFSVFQAIIGILQFSWQRSIGLHLLGEPYLTHLGGPASKVSLEGGMVLRAYGTFPHPNIFGAFLVLGIIALAYSFLYLDKKLYTWHPDKTIKENFSRFISSPSLYLRILIAIGLFVNIFGLAISFSRGAWASAVFGLAVLIGVSVFSGYGRSIGRLLVVLIFSLLTVYFVLSPVIIPRTHISRGDDAVNYRLIYGQIGLELINAEPLGTGIGNQVIYSVKNKIYQDHGLDKVWEWEPIHNLYLLIGSEIGIVGLLSFLVFVIMVLLYLLFGKRSLEKNLGLGMLTAFIIFGLFDHFLWTLQPGKLMLWFVIGISLVAIQLRKKV